MAKAGHGSQIGRFIPSMIFIGSLLFVAVLYLNSHYPHMLGSVVDSISPPTDSETIESGIKQQERNRIDTINRLLISEKNKNDLRQGRPFWGAPPHMVDLAFATPADDAVIQRKGNRLFEFHYFGFKGNREPIVVEYQDSALTCVHYSKDEKTHCNPGNESFYANGSFPFNYKITVGH